ncbi:MAG TPA: hypothetical protein VHM66_06170 [Solirubrobacterales bacterium]|nr:hypothetical protein [Solirubrobacterales bacterium]
MLGIDTEARRWWTLAGACAGLFLPMLDSTVVALALPAIRGDVGASSGGERLPADDRGARRHRWPPRRPGRPQAGS